MIRVRQTSIETACAGSRVRQSADPKVQLQLLHEGTLLIAPGIVTERLSNIDARIAEVQHKTTEAWTDFYIYDPIRLANSLIQRNLFKTAMHTRAGAYAGQHSLGPPGLRASISGEAPPRGWGLPGAGSDSSACQPLTSFRRVVTLNRVQAFSLRRTACVLSF
jgi:hypothetical protein